MKPMTTADFTKRKAAGEKIAMLTCYDAMTAKLMAESGIEAVLVGDSLGMTVLGYADTLSVTMDDMVRHTRAVKRGAPSLFVVADMPFMSYQVSVEEAVRNAGRLIAEGGAQAVKLEGGAAYADVVRAIVRAGIPVMGHVGLTPQSVNALGGYRVQAKTEDAAQVFLEDARSLETAGVLSMVFECVPREVAQWAAERLTVPVIGIGAGVGDALAGQILVWQDMSGLNEGFSPKFVRRFSAAGAEMKKGFADYAAAVRAGSFPADNESFAASDDVLAKLY